MVGLRKTDGCIQGMSAERGRAFDRYNHLGTKLGEKPEPLLYNWRPGFARPSLTGIQVAELTGRKVRLLHSLGVDEDPKGRKGAPWSHRKERFIGFG